MPLKRRYRISQKFGLIHFNTKNKYTHENTPEHTRVIKLYGRKIYWKLLKFMNHDISIRQKYLTKTIYLKLQ